MTQGLLVGCSRDLHFDFLFLVVRIFGSNFWEIWTRNWKQIRRMRTLKFPESSVLNDRGRGLIFRGAWSLGELMALCTLWMNLLELGEISAQHRWDLTWVGWLFSMYTSFSSDFRHTSTGLLLNCNARILYSCLDNLTLSWSRSYLLKNLHYKCFWLLLEFVCLKQKLKTEFLTGFMITQYVFTPYF